MKSSPQELALLAKRIAAALNTETPSDEIAALIEEAQRARVAAEEAHGKAYARALDPTAGADDASVAKHEADDLRFEMDRLGSALDVLRRAHNEAKARESNEQRRAAYDAAKAERDALVQELREVYPDIERRLVGLVARVAANDAELERVNRSRPNKAPWLTGAEEVARGGRERFANYQEWLRHQITTGLRLPRFDIDPLSPFVWPTS
jgi:hypothetical protein